VGEKRGSIEKKIKRQEKRGLGAIVTSIWEKGYDRASQSEGQKRKKDLGTERLEMRERYRDIQQRRKGLTRRGKFRGGGLKRS